MKRIDLKRFYPHLLAVLAFFAITGVYFAPTLQGKDLVQEDAISSRGWGDDLREYHEKTGEYAHWSNAMFGGMPANYTYMPKSENVFRHIGRLFTLAWMGGTGRHNGYIFLSLVCFYVFLIAIGCNSWLSFMGSVAYTLCSYNLIIVGVGHMNKALVMATMAPIIGGVIMCYRGRLLAGAFVTLLFSGLNVYWNHQQVSYYLLLVLLFLAAAYLVCAVREGQLRRYFKATGVLVVVAVLAVLPSIGQLWPTMDYAKESVRGAAILKPKNDAAASSGLDIDYAYQWSYGIDETLTLLIPNIYGASSHYDLGIDSETYKLFSRSYGRAQAKTIVKQMPAYWGAQPFTSGPVYIGAIVCFLFVLSLFVVKGRDKWWLLAATVLGLVLAWGKNFMWLNEFFFYNLPLYNKFRAPSMALVVPSLTMVTLAVLAVARFMKVCREGDEAAKKSLSRALKISFAITGGFSLLLALFGDAMFAFEAPSDASYPALLVDALRADRASLLTSDAWRSFAFITASAVALFAYMRFSFKSRYLYLALTLLVLVDLWGVAWRFLSWSDFVPKKQVEEFAPTAADKLILRDKHPNYRVLNLATSTFNDSRTSYFHKSVGGYSPAKLRRYQDLIDNYFGNGINMNIINMLNVRYIILPDEEGRPQVQANPDAMGNCWFVDKIVWVDTPDEEIEAIGTADLRSTVFMEKAWQATLPDSDKYNHPADSTAFIDMVELVNPGVIKYKSHALEPRLAIFSEVYHKTWKAYIDGEEVPLLRANYLLRALPVPAGEHTLELRCVDEVILTSAKISLYASILTGAILLSLFVILVCKRVKKEEE